MTELTRNQIYYAANKERMKAMKRASMQIRRAENPELFRAQYRRHAARTRAALLDLYGHCCAVCGFSDKRALTLDHKKNNGNEERRQIGERGVYRKALVERSTDDYQILCMNCQFIKHVESKTNVQPQHGECLEAPES